MNVTKELYLFLLSFDFSRAHCVQSMEVLSTPCIMNSWPCDLLTVLCPSLGKGSRTWMLWLGFTSKTTTWQVSITHYNFSEGFSLVKKEGAQYHAPSSVPSYAPCNYEQRQAAGPWELQSEGWSLQSDSVVPDLINHISENEWACWISVSNYHVVFGRILDGAAIVTLETTDKCSP